MKVKSSPTNINRTALWIKLERVLAINAMSSENLALLLIKVTPIPARMTNKADARPCKSVVKDRSILLPVSAFMAILKFTSIIPNRARARAKSKPVILSCIGDRIS